MYTLMRSNNISLLNIIETEADDVSANNPALDWVSRVLPEEQQQIQGPRPCRNYFSGGLLSNNAETALHVTRRPDQTDLTINAIAAMYHLVDFPEEYSRFLGLYGADVESTWRIFDRITIWHKFRVQLYSVFRPSMIMPSQVVQAKPPSDDFPLGCGDVVVVKAGDDSLCPHFLIDSSSSMSFITRYKLHRPSSHGISTLSTSSLQGPNSIVSYSTITLCAAFPCRIDSE